MSAGGLDAHLVARRGAFTLDLHLTVAPGEVVALVGPNGAGKSTVLRVLAGLAPLDAGTVRLGGRTLDGPGTHVHPERRRCGVTFQDHLLFEHLTARENVAFGLRARGMRAGPARAVAGAWLDRLGIGAYAGARAGTLSGGQSQRVALARALAGEPELLLLDEPFAALDARTRQDVRAVLRAHLAEAPRPVVLVTHDPGDAAELADRVVVLADGHAVREGRTVDLAGPGSAGRFATTWFGPDAGVAPDDPAASDPSPTAGVVILAGGTARRIGGGDKTALDVGGRSILHRLLVDVAPLPTVVVADDPGVREREPFPHARWVRERPVGAGPAVALAAGFAALPTVDVVVAVAGDQPFAGPVVPRLLRVLAEHPAADAAFGVDSDGREQPLLAAYRAAAVRHRLAAVRPGDALRTVRAGLAVRPVGLSAGEALDVDDAADLARARCLTDGPAEP